MKTRARGGFGGETVEVRLRLGEGLLSGYASALLGLASLGGVLCFAYPALLTTGDLRELYDPAVLLQDARTKMTEQAVASIQSLHGKELR